MVTRSPARLATVVLVAVVTVIVATTSRAACPPAWSGSQYDATAGVVRWCVPDLSAAGVAHRPGELARCDWTFDWTGGGAPVTVSESAPTPGTIYRFTASNATGLGSVRGQCFNVLGVGGAEWALTPAAFPTGAPGQPRLVP